MLLKDKYFQIERVSRDGDAVSCHVRLLADCDVYRGHFPGNPVSPGVCNIEMVAECFNQSCGGHRRIKSIDRCRFTAVASPSVCPELDVIISWSDMEGDSISVAATVKDDKRQYMDFKGVLS